MLPAQNTETNKKPRCDCCLPFFEQTTIRFQSKPHNNRDTNLNWRFKGTKLSKSCNARRPENTHNQASSAAANTVMLLLLLCQLSVLREHSFLRHSAKTRPTLLLLLLLCVKWLASSLSPFNTVLFCTC